MSSFLGRATRLDLPVVGLRTDYFHNHALRSLRHICEDARITGPVSSLGLFTADSGVSNLTQLTASPNKGLIMLSSWLEDMPPTCLYTMSPSLLTMNVVGM